ncbi:Hypothetical predicted protein [Mytilus galloprovincialis]|uniref:Uncharacterized protein n=1 Tax=Mytilus galloprovincialis TaxID=29158 RepID=A0A8B6GI96_MYTGA|nr:Hypothetical predicted protein [Mytilus galloprovincialis]
MYNLVKFLLPLVGRKTKLNSGEGKCFPFKKSPRGLLYLDLTTLNGSMKLNLGLDELDDLFTLRGHLESLTAYFPQPLSQPQEQVVPKENVAPVYALPPPPTPFMEELNKTNKDVVIIDLTKQDEHDEGNQERNCKKRKLIEISSDEENKKDDMIDLTKQDEHDEGNKKKYIANLEVNYERCHENFVEFRDRFSQYIASEKSHEKEIPEESDIVPIDSSLSSRFSFSSQSRFRSAKVKRLIAELKLRKLSEQCELELAQIDTKFRQQYCRGEAMWCIEDCVLLVSDEDFKRASAILYSRYGRPHVIARSFIEKLVYGAQIKASDIEGLSKLALDLEKYEITLSQLGFNSDIDNSENLRCIVKRLPMHMRTKLIDIAHSIGESGREPRFSDLAKFVDEKSRIASSMYGYDLLEKTIRTRLIIWFLQVNIIIMIQFRVRLLC